MKVSAIKTRVFHEGENLIDFIFNHIPVLEEGSILVVTSKIVALSEGRTAEIKNKKTKELLIKEESQWAKNTKYTWLTIKDGMFMASAGIDESNGNGKLILLPSDSFKSARSIWKHLRRSYRVKKLGVVITDSRTIPLRAGVIGLAVGYYGFTGINDYRGKKDIFGRKFRFSQTNVADSLATSAVLVMGEGDEQQPLAVVTDFLVKFIPKTRRRELKIDLDKDMYRPLLKKFDYKS